MNIHICAYRIYKHFAFFGPRQRHVPMKISYKLDSSVDHPSHEAPFNVYFPFGPSHEQFPGRSFALAGCLYLQHPFQGLCWHRKTRIHRWQDEETEQGGLVVLMGT